MELTKKYINELTYKIIGACIEVHKIVGPGLYEEIYHKCLEREFDLLGIKYKSELEIPLIYKGLKIDCKVKCDFLIENAIVLEIKSVTEFHNIHRAQTMNYMNLLKVSKSILVNFNVYNLYHEGTETFVNKDFENLL
ncbi:GxxExxY protein [Chryseobacterium gambrini]|uniref:GxxExxY protein n=2 Tax=Chryseobacterium TaxID=59732 RepID=A0AAJ1R9I7_9FLAO|nr:MULTISPECIES: GxxExxY protein [Chryseobacterium]MCF2220071.1 GxxExxY protein [Chryseobacterium sp. PS-8]MDN4014742.1 GxxExxY protein [Chryseobacterium gambrini]MDN4031831.1 GxxExxY protein [Chryseobacterium gambrini]QWA37996.1 GxxExxY protein [Chryseobacterium sp. ZHDP1]